MNSEISIIIPTYNRSHLIGKTLESILAQTFQNWKCIVVDDNSTDNTNEVMKDYCEKDQRIRFIKRPSNLKKGANSCRNYGFEKSSSPFIKWFDSDDIMYPNHLELMYSKLVDNDLDFVISDSRNFDSETGKIMGKPFEFDREKAAITPENYALYRIGWITDDFLGTRKFVEKIRFNEDIVDGDEYNFFIKLLHQPFKCFLIDDVLSLRRIHNDSISILNKLNSNKYDSIIAALKYQTANDLTKFNNIKLIRWFLSGYMQYAFKLSSAKCNIPYFFSAFKLIKKYFSIFKGITFLMSLFTAKFFNSGYRLLKYSRT